MQSAVTKPTRSKSRVVMSTLDVQRSLGAMLLKEQLVTANDLSAVQEKILSSGDTISLLYWLRELQIVDESRILNCIRRCQPDVPIGSLLVELQYIEPDKLERAVDIQGEESFVRKLGQVLLDNNWVEPNDLGKALAAQLGFEFINPTFEHINFELVSRAGADTCRRFEFLPVVQREGSIVVAFADPMDQEARTAAARVLSSVIVPVMCVESCINKQLDLHRRKATPSVADLDEARDVDLPNLIQRALAHGASDIHIEPLKETARIRFRVDGLLRFERDITHQQRQTIIAKLKNLAELDIGERGRHQSGRFSHIPDNGDHPKKMHCSFFITENGECAVMRVNTRQDGVVKLAQLGIYESILNRFKEHALEAPSGSIVLTGPYGSGKTSTLYSCIDHLNNEHSNVVSVEDNIEYAIDGVKQCLVNRRVGGSYGESIVHMTKQDLDVLVVGEIRDAEVAKSVIQVMLRGHKVLTTFCSGDGVGVLLRMKNLNSESFTVSSTVRAMISQRLVRKVCQHCTEAYQPTVAERERYGLTLEDLAVASFAQGKGCSACGDSGYDGRIGVYEVLLIDEPLREAVLMGKTSAQIRQIGVEQCGLITLIEDGILKAASGATSLQELNRVLPRTSEPRSLSQLRSLVF